MILKKFRPHLRNQILVIIIINMKGHLIHIKLQVLIIILLLRMRENTRNTAKLILLTHIIILRKMKNQRQIMGIIINTQVHLQQRIMLEINIAQRIQMLS
jgi:hypothetical protein